ncbi:hypothetical protein [Winogradskyella sp.]|uniref:hypothetical protein n=1 Tax=Winogradskyella sp. TaxID=1883156 RepID=UPI0035116DE1
MKTLFKFICMLLLSAICTAQEKNIETESIILENFISYIVEEFEVKEDSIPRRNITFLIETYADDFNVEDRVILKQAFRLISKRLTKKDSLSIVSYSEYSGIMLNRVAATEAKKLLYAIENPKSSIAYLENDGIELAYKIANDAFTEDSENSVVMIRMPNRVVEVVEQKKAAKQNINSNTSNNKSNNGSAIMLTAIALLPEIIAVIKD